MILMVESKITRKGQTTIPRPVREALGLQTGDTIRYLIRDGEVRIKPVRPIDRLYGILKYDGPPVTLEQMNRAIRDMAAKNVRP